MMSTQYRSFVCSLAVLAVAFGMTVMVHPADATKNPEFLDPVWSAPVPAPDQARVLAADAAGVIAVGRGGEVQSIDADGRQRWRVELGQVTTIDPVAIDSSLVVVPVNDEAFVALERSTGARRWTRSVPQARVAGIGRDAAGASIVATMTATGQLDLLDGATGMVRWTSMLPVRSDAFAERVWLTQGRVIAAWGGVRDMLVAARDVHDGRTIWAEAAANTATLPAVSSDSVVFAENVKFIGKHRVIGRVRSLDVVSGVERWHRRVRGPFWPHFETAADAAGVVIVDDKGRITLLDARTGRVRWQQATKRRQLEVSPRLLDDVVAITTYGTGLTALVRSDGSSVVNSIPGQVQYAFTIEASAAAGDRLYLLVQGHDGRAEVWALGPLET
jgi:outer membrane protein assembly factor BamB